MTHSHSNWHQQVVLGALCVRAAARGPSLVVSRMSAPPQETDPMPLDRAMIPLLERIWALGLTTGGSCSGHWNADDHRYSGSWVSIVADTPERQALLQTLIAGTWQDLALPPGIKLEWSRTGAWHQREDDITMGPRLHLTLEVLSSHREVARAVKFHRRTIRYLCQLLDRIGEKPCVSITTQ